MAARAVRSDRARPTTGAKATCRVERMWEAITDRVIREAVVPGGEKGRGVSESSSKWVGVGAKEGAGKVTDAPWLTRCRRRGKYGSGGKYSRSRIPQGNSDRADESESADSATTA